MEITLMIDGNEKVFKAPFVSARRLREAFELKEKYNKLLTANGIDELVDFEVEVYGKQFTRDQFYDGFPSDKVFEKVLSDMGCIIDGMNEKLDSISGKN